MQSRRHSRGRKPPALQAPLCNLINITLLTDDEWTSCHGDLIRIRDYHL